MPGRILTQAARRARTRSLPAFSASTTEGKVVYTNTARSMPRASTFLLNERAATHEPTSRPHCVRHERHFGFRYGARDERNAVATLAHEWRPFRFRGMSGLPGWNGRGVCKQPFPALS